MYHDWDSKLLYTPVVYLYPGHGMVIKPNLMGLQIHEKDFYSQRKNRGWPQSTNSSMAQSPVNNATWMHFFKHMNMSHRDIGQDDWLLDGKHASKAEIFGILEGAGPDAQ